MFTPRIDCQAYLFHPAEKIKQDFSQIQAYIFDNIRDTPTSFFVNSHYGYVYNKIIMFDFQIKYII